MEKFILKATITEELPEVEIEAETREEAEEKYIDLYTEGEIEAETFTYDFNADEADEEEE